MSLLLHLSAPDGQHPEWRHTIDANLPRKIVPPPKDSALASEPGYKDLGPLRIWKNLPPNWAEKGLIWERISPEEVETIVRQYPNLAGSAPSFVKVYALEPEPSSGSVAFVGGPRESWTTLAATRHLLQHRTGLEARWASRRARKTRTVS